ncbi:putative RIBOSOME BINDING PROTEIN-1 [Babesia divergens]|uniref:RIBOSOME BINDING PROTEIN-1 n=1 Tax=Babesia divergens TaxID=32595 RepID=A0AAD9LF86_BABDI|nr:putative RIBOSOME BINDING PROTEIN-1 [Babesia divergens]
MTMTSCDFKDPETLKDILVELGKLHNATSTRHKVFEQLKIYLKAYCGDTYLNDFYQDLGGSYGPSGSMKLLTKAGHDICETILQNSPTGGRHDTAHSKHEGKDCAEKISNALKKCLPKAYAALYFLLFMGSEDMNTLQGGQWKDYACNGNDYDYRGGYGYGSKVDLYLWLTDRKGENTGLVKRDFPTSTHDLNSNKGQQVADNIKQIIKHDSAAALQRVLCGFMFVCKWDDALTGHACLFLSMFCNKVNGDSGNTFQKTFQRTYTSNDSDTFKELCTALKPKLDPFIDGTASGIQAVCQHNQKLFEKIWNEDKFKEYCEWLKTRLDSIIQSLNTMSSDSSQWNSSNLKDASSAGPFKYGFVFKDKSWEDGNINEKLSPLITSLTGGESGSLKSLLQCLNGNGAPTSERITTEPAKSSSGAAAAGGATAVLGIGGAGFGAAYGFNLFGLKDIMSGVFGAIRGLVVGF